MNEIPTPPMTVVLVDDRPPPIDHLVLDLRRARCDDMNDACSLDRS